MFQITRSLPKFNQQENLLIYNFFELLCLERDRHMATKAEPLQKNSDSKIFWFRQNRTTEHNMVMSQADALW